MLHQTSGLKSPNLRDWLMSGLGIMRRFTRGHKRPT